MLSSSVLKKKKKLLKVELFQEETSDIKEGQEESNSKHMKCDNLLN